SGITLPLSNAEAPSPENVKLLNVVEAEPDVIPAASYVEAGVTLRICQGLVKLIVTGGPRLAPDAEAEPENPISPTIGAACVCSHKTPQLSNATASVVRAVFIVLSIPLCP